MILSRYERMIAKRYLLPGKGEAFIALVASISLVAVMLGVAALIIVMSVMNGFRAELIEKSIGVNGQAVVQGYGNDLRDWRMVMEEAKKTPGVTEVTPLIETPLMASFDGRVEPVLVRGMTMDDITKNSLIAKSEVAGSLKALKPGSMDIAIGSQLAQKLGVNVGNEISLISPQGQTTVFGTVPRIVSYRVVALFEVGIYQYDEAFVVMPLENAQTLFLMGDSVGMIEVNTEDPDNVRDILKPLAEKVNGIAVVNDWQSMNSALFEALAVERVAMFVVLSIIVLVAVFNILSSLIMLVRAKRRDIAILRTMGATRGGLIKIFVSVGTTIGALGTGAGVILAFIFLHFRQPIVNFVQWLTGQNLWDPTIRFLTELPSKPNPVEIMVVIFMGLGLSFLATLYPAFKAASTDPVEVLRYE